jgi:hypothetical protein
MSCEDLERLMPVFEKCDPVWSRFLQQQIARGRHYPKEAGCVREADGRTQMSMLFLLGITITKPDRIEDLLPDYTVKGVTFYESIRNQVGEAICGKNGMYRKERQKLEIELGGVYNYLSARCVIDVTITGRDWRSGDSNCAFDLQNRYPRLL